MTAHPDKPHWWRHAEGVENVFVCIYDGCHAAKAKPDSVVRSVGEQCPSKHPRTLVRCEFDAGRHRFHRAGELQWFETVENPAVRQCQSINLNNRLQAVQCEYPEGPHNAHKRGMWLWWDTDAAPKRTFIAQVNGKTPTVEALKNFLADVPSEAKLSITTNGNEYSVRAEWSA